jgi:hypothetical protein
LTVKGSICWATKISWRDFGLPVALRGLLPLRSPVKVLAKPAKTDIVSFLLLYLWINSKGTSLWINSNKARVFWPLALWHECNGGGRRATLCSVAWVVDYSKTEKRKDSKVPAVVETIFI